MNFMHLFLEPCTEQAEGEYLVWVNWAASEYQCPFDRDSTTLSTYRIESQVSLSRFG